MSGPTWTCWSQPHAQAQRECFDVFRHTLQTARSTHICMHHDAGNWKTQPRDSPTNANASSITYQWWRKNGLTRCILTIIVNLAPLHSSVNWHSHSPCKVYSLGTREPGSTAFIGCDFTLCERVWRHVRRPYCVSGLWRNEGAAEQEDNFNHYKLLLSLCMVNYSSLHLRLSPDMSDNLHFGLAC